MQKQKKIYAVAKHYFDQAVSGIKLKKILKGKFPELTPKELNAIIQSIKREEREKTNDT